MVASSDDCEMELQVFPADIRGNSPIQRRAVLTAGLAGVIHCAFPRVVLAMTAIDSASSACNRRFSVLYKGRRVGAHAITFSPENEEMRIETEIHLVVKIAFFTVFAFSHRSEEVWRDGQLKSLNGETVERGETLYVEGVATPFGFRGLSKVGPFGAAAATLTTNSLWNRTLMEQETVIDAQHGGIIGVSAHQVGDENIVIGDRQVHATRYAFITPDLAGSVWYDEKDLWVRGEFERDGSRLQYEL